MGRPEPLANPVKAAAVCARIIDRPAGPSRNERVGARAQNMRLLANRQLRPPARHKYPSLRRFIRLWRGTPPGRRQFHRVLGKCLGKAAQRAGKDPDPRPLPARQQAGHDIALHIRRDQCVGVRKNRTPKRITGLIRMPTGRKCICWLCHCFTLCGNSPRGICSPAHRARPNSPRHLVRTQPAQPQTAQHINLEKYSGGMRPAGRRGQSPKDTRIERLSHGPLRRRALP